MRKSSMVVFMTVAIGLLLIASCGEEGEVRSEGGGLGQKIVLAERISDTTTYIQLRSKDADLNKDKFVIREYASETYVPVVAVESLKAGKEANIKTEALARSKNYEIGVISDNKTNFFEAQFGDAYWEPLYSEKPLGCTVEGESFVFRVFSPRAEKVVLCLFDEPYTEKLAEGNYKVADDARNGTPKYKGETQIEMKMDEMGVWEAKMAGEYYGKLYGYRIFGPKGGSEMFNPNFIIADPYSKALATLQVSPQQHLTVIVDTASYEWASEEKYAPVKRREAIIYEMHVRDLTMLSPDVENKGTYDGLVEDEKTGGIAHIKNLGVNIVELLPTHEFNEIEEPYSEKGFANKWNTYGRNHWGYMTTCFFAPEAFYYEGKFKAGQWIGVDGGQLNAFKRMVDAFHQNGIGVMMDVVFNHVSQYDRNPFKYIDKKYYFWLNAFGADDAKSGCGNDYKTDRPMSRRVIVDSCVYFVDECRVDGYRFDLGTIIDWKTYETLIPKVRALNPECHLTAEPWMGGRGEPRDGGGYAFNDNNGFDKRDMGAWNDKIRNVIRQGGLTSGNASVPDLKNGVLGFPKIVPNNVANSFNYAESHDNNTLSDIIREANKEEKKNDEIMPDRYLEACKLNEKSLKQNKIAALYLLTTLGPIMLHQGQEMARKKVVYPPSGDSVFPPNSANWKKDEKGKWMDGDKKWSTKPIPYITDHDSYEKDNEANWINWKLLDVNKDLFNYYKGLIQIRKANPVFATMDRNAVTFIEATAISGSTKPKSALGYVYDKKGSKDSKSFVILVNGTSTDVAFELPAGNWTVIADGDSAPAKGNKKLSGKVTVPAVSGMILNQ